MADNSGFIKIAAIGAAVYLAYTQGWLSFLGLGTASSASTASTGTPAATGANLPAVSVPVATVATTPPSPKANVLDGIYTAMVKAANAPSAGLGVDAWGYYLNQQLGPLGLSAPDPMPLFQAYVTSISAPPPGGSPGQPATFDRSTYTFSGPTYWAVMAPALRSQLGLSGLGLYGGLGALMRRYA